MNASAPAGRPKRAAKPACARDAEPLRRRAAARDASMAIAEYAPGSEVVAGGRIWTSAGITRRTMHGGGVRAGVPSEVAEPDPTRRAARSELLTPAEDGGLALAVKGDGRFTRTSSGAASGTGGRLEVSDADGWLLRTGMEGARRFALGGGDGSAAAASCSRRCRVPSGGGRRSSGQSPTSGAPRCCIRFCKAGTNRPSQPWSPSPGGESSKPW